MIEAETQNKDGVIPAEKTAFKSKTRITRIVIEGFKSFAKYTEMLMSDKFNIILGPNGSGKSNVLDALNEPDVPGLELSRESLVITFIPALPSPLPLSRVNVPQLPSSLILLL